jgi:hypothetical protein
MRTQPTVCVGIDKNTASNLMRPQEAEKFQTFTQAAL